jgi:hypothetical protein
MFINDGIHKVKDVPRKNIKEPSKPGDTEIKTGEEKISSNV